MEQDRQAKKFSVFQITRGQQEKSKYVEVF